MIFIGTALTTGQELDWFRSSLITFLLIFGVISLIFLFYAVGQLSILSLI